MKSKIKLYSIKIHAHTKVIDVCSKLDLGQPIPLMLAWKSVVIFIDLLFLLLYWLEPVWISAGRAWVTGAVDIYWRPLF